MFNHPMATRDMGLLLAFCMSLCLLSSSLAQNPIPQRRKFTDVVPLGDLTVYSDRWSWIDRVQDDEGMYQIWDGESDKGLSAEQRHEWVDMSLSTRAGWFTLAPTTIP